MKKGAYYVMIVLAGILWGLTGLFARRLYAAGMTAANVSAVRVMISGAVLAAVNAVTKPEAFRIRKEDLLLLMCTGIISKFGSTFCYAQSQKLCSLAVSGILLYTAPAIVVIFSAILWKEPITKKKLVALILTMLGCALVTGVFSSEQTATPFGIAIGFAAGFTYALYTVFSHYALKKYSAASVTMWAFVFGSIGSVLTMDVGNMAETLIKPGIIPIAISIAVISSLLPNFLYTTGLAHVESGRASIVASLDPAVSALLGAVVFHEETGIAIILGLACIIVSICLLRK